MMRLYILNNITSGPSFEINHTIVVRAKSPERAHQLASSVAIDEGPQIWLDPEKSTCEWLESKGNEEVIITDNNAT